MLACVCEYLRNSNELLMILNEFDITKPVTSFLLFQDRGILSESMGRDADVGYILSLGVHRKYRQNGIGSLLLDSLINHLTTAERHKVKAIFLHVLTTNQTAILFYERRGWVELFSSCFFFQRNIHLREHTFATDSFSTRSCLTITRFGGSAKMASRTSRTSTEATHRGRYNILFQTSHCFLFIH